MFTSITSTMQLETLDGNIVPDASNCNFSQPASELMVSCSNSKHDSPRRSQVISLTAAVSTGKDIEDAEPDIPSLIRKMISNLCVSEDADVKTEEDEDDDSSDDNTEEDEDDDSSDDNTEEDEDDDSSDVNTEEDEDDDSSDVNTEEDDDYQDDDSVDENTVTRIIDPKSTYASEIYQYWRASETDKRPSIDFVEMMERVQKETGGETRRRLLLVDWLVDLTEVYNLVPDTLYLAVSYVDRLLSIKPDNWKCAYSVGAACLLIASKYEEIRNRSKIKKLSNFLADHLRCTKADLYIMESCVLRVLKFDITTPTTACFLRLFLNVATEEEAADEDALLQPELESMASYIAELSLLDYTMNRYAPSLIAASSIFLAKFILNASKRPTWTSTLENSTLYKPSDLHECVEALHHLCRYHDPEITRIRKKYSSMASKQCPPTIPCDFFFDGKSS